MFIQLQPQYLTIWELELELFAIEQMIMMFVESLFCERVR